ncbi:MAG: hypothetical protein OQK44_05570, partial [Gammaproteobacteria bacterium]|nr:hypothetical protein [Gammaproteobacteria bacterium]
TQAERGAEFIRARLYDKKSGMLHRQYRSQKDKIASATQATLSDYAWLIYGLLEMYEAGNDNKWLRWAFELHEKQDELFLDDSTGAYFESVANDDSLLFRSKSINDDALPSANAIALSNLYKLSDLASRPSDKKILSSRARRLVNSFASTVNQDPSAAAMLLAIELERASEKRVEARPEAAVLQ